MLREAWSETRSHVSVPFRLSWQPPRLRWRYQVRNHLHSLHSDALVMTRAMISAKSSPARARSGRLESGNAQVIATSSLPR